MKKDEFRKLYEKFSSFPLNTANLNDSVINPWLRTHLDDEESLSNIKDLTTKEIAAEKQPEGPARKKRKTEGKKYPPHGVIKGKADTEPGQGQEETTDSPAPQGST